MSHAQRKETHHVPVEESRIDVHDGDSVDYWARKLGCTLLQLQLAVKRVGASPIDVEKHLRRW